MKQNIHDCIHETGPKYWYTAKMENETKKTIYEITKGGVMYSQKGAATTNDNVALQTV